ncbi:MAG: LysM peptidoglycan-binding domain-containing protein, partial [Kiritimatiellae bacterium]|nr:LysM peptidoglycan-binding domain-containing protein [Kiritimatiellia bacterium]
PPPADTPAAVVPPAPAPAPVAPAAPAVAPAPAPAAPVPAAPAGGVNYQTHTVKAGEDVYAVAIRWGVSPTDIKALNNLTGSELTEGTVLKIPPAPAP